MIVRMIVIVMKFLRKFWSGLIAVKRHTRAHVPSLQMQLTKGKKCRKVAQKKSRSGNKIVPTTVRRVAGSQQYADWIVELSCSPPFLARNSIICSNIATICLSGWRNQIQNWKTLVQLTKFYSSMAQIKRQMETAALHILAKLTYLYNIYSPSQIFVGIHLPFWPPFHSFFII